MGAKPPGMRGGIPSPHFCVWRIRDGLAYNAGKLYLYFTFFVWFIVPPFQRQTVGRDRCYTCPIWEALMASGSC